jgi:O-antigen ligase
VRTASSRRQGGALLVAALVVAVAVGYAIASPDPTYQLLALSVVGLSGLVAGTQHPSLGLALGAAIPLSAQAFSVPRLPYFGLALLALVILRTWPGAPRAGHWAALLIAAFGALTIGFGLLLATAVPDRLSLIIAVGYSTVLGVAAALTRMSTAWLMAVIAALGVWISMAAWQTPELAVDRTLALLGENANGVGMFAGVGVVSALVMLKQRSIPVRLLALGATVTCLLGVYVSGSRGAAVVCFVGVAVLLFGRLLRGRTVGGASRAAVVLLAVALLSYELVGWFGDVTGRVARGADVNLTARSESLSYALHVGSEHPLFGVGLTRLGEVSRLDLTSGAGLRAHNAYAGVFAELGAVGLVPLLLLCALAVVRSRQRSSEGLALVAAVLSAGISLEWWGDGGTGPLAMLVLGWAVGQVGPPEPAPRAPQSSPATSHLPAAVAKLSGNNR